MMMKKLLATLLILGSLLTLVACDHTDDNETTASTNETTTEFTADSSTTPISTQKPNTPVETPPITYEVKFIGANGKEFSPFEESMFFTDIQIYSNGEYSELTGDGYLAFYSVQNYLPMSVDKIPTVTLDEASEIVITAREGVSFEDITTVDVYGEDGEAYQRLAEDMTLAEIVEKGKNEWKNELLYLYFDVGFGDTGASYNKSVRNGFFVKTFFSDAMWGIDVRLETSELGLTVPHKEMLYMRTYNDGNQYVSDGPLMFYKTEEYLPNFAESIPTVTWDENFELSYSMEEGITYRGGEKFHVYGEDYTELAKAISRDELIAKSKTDWADKTVYIQFGGVFYHKINDEITENVENAYFVKTTFAK